MFMYCVCTNVRTYMYAPYICRWNFWDFVLVTLLYYKHCIIPRITMVYMYIVHVHFVFVLPSYMYMYNQLNVYCVETLYFKMISSVYFYNQEVKWCNIICSNLWSSHWYLKIKYYFLVHFKDFLHAVVGLA